MATIGRRPRGRAVRRVVASVLLPFLAGVWSAEAKQPFTFPMVPSSNAIKNCLPGATATVTIKDKKINQVMKVKAEGLAPNTGYDLFVLQVPHAKFGIAWYQSELETNKKGKGVATVQGIFSIETFSISQDTLTTTGRAGTPQTGATFGAVNQYHLGLWFDDPQVPFDLGCEPSAMMPAVTPFNGEQHAGIQVLNTSNFGDNDGPLRHFPPSSPSGAFIDGIR
jgi:hypothetical protein